MTFQEITALEFHLHIESGNKKQCQWCYYLGYIVGTLRLLDGGQ